MRIAVVGAGISGLSAAWALRNVHDVTLFEKEARLGGHANTVTVDYDGMPIDVDTGFIVYNELNYPHLTALFRHLGVNTRQSDMSFSLSDPSGFEWSSNGLGGLFAWKRNLTRPQFLCMLNDIVRFSAAAREDLARNSGRVLHSSLEDYVASLKLGRSFLRQYLLPMGAAIWSTPERDMLRFPAASFLRFFDNHRLLHVWRPIWRTVQGGSRSYVEVMRAQLGDRIRAGDAVTEVRRSAGAASILTQSGSRQDFDRVILACHSDEALGLLHDATPGERRLLGAIKFAPNVAYLHRDTTLMPQRRRAWGAWNYLRNSGGDDRVCVSYWMNALQGVDPSRPLFVTLNPATPPDPALTFATFAYDHPQFDLAAIQAQKELGALQGVHRTYFAGAWMGYGFHEDGLTSGLAVANALDAQTPWDTATLPPPRFTAFGKAAEAHAA